MKDYYKQTKRFITKVLDLYDNKHCIIGKTENKRYVQLIPVVKLYHIKDDGEICILLIENRSDFKVTKCKQCGERINFF